MFDFVPRCYEAVLFFAAIAGALLCVWLTQKTVFEDLKFKDLQRAALLFLSFSLALYAFYRTAAATDLVVLAAVLLLIVRVVRASKWAEPKQDRASLR